VFLALFVNVTLVRSKALDLPPQQRVAFPSGDGSTTDLQQQTKEIAFPGDDGSSNKREKKSLSNYGQAGLQ